MSASILTPNECRRLQLSILADFHDHCVEHDLTYYLAYGTLLGCVRHGGYIPWDDDIDVMMPRPDYERLRRGSPEIGNYVARGGDQDAAWPFSFLKISDTQTRIEEGGAIDADVGVNIDVFPLDTVSPEPIRAVKRALISLLSALLAVQAIAPRVGRSKVKRFAVGAISPLARRLPRSVLLQVMDHLARGPERSGHSGVLVGSYQWSTPTAAFSTPRHLSFEEELRNVPTDPHTVLGAKYGAHYMQLPPIESQVTHHTFIAYRR